VFTHSSVISAFNDRMVKLRSTHFYKFIAAMVCSTLFAHSSLSVTSAFCIFGLIKVMREYMQATWELRFCHNNKLSNSSAGRHILMFTTLM